MSRSGDAASGANGQWLILLCFDLERNGETLTVNLDFKGVAVAAFEIDRIDASRDEDRDIALALFALIHGDSDDLASVSGPFDFIDDFSRDAVFTATEAGGSVLHVGYGEFAKSGEVLGSFIEDEFTCHEGGYHRDGNDDVDGDVTFITR